MRYLGFLNQSRTDEIRKLISGAMHQELEKRHWGAPAPKGRWNVPQYYIFDLRGLFLACGLLRYHLREHATVFYRGQYDDWELVASVFRNLPGDSRKAHAKRREEWLERALDVANDFDPKGTRKEREALLQHYGLPTRWLDVADNVHTAAWFAYSAEDKQAEVDGKPGFIALLACPKPKGPSHKWESFDLRTKPSEWLRPHVQQAWCIRHADPSVALTRKGSFQDLHVITFVVARQLLRQWSNFEAIGRNVMYPDREDSGQRFWEQTLRKLKDSKLWPAYWKPSAVDSGA